MLGLEFKGLNDLQKGYIALIFGVILLLDTLNIFEAWLNGIMIVISILLIAYGVIKTDLIKKTLRLIQKVEEESETIDIEPEEKE